jgi:hypothetical protein
MYRLSLPSRHRSLEYIIHLALQLTGDDSVHCCRQVSIVKIEMTLRGRARCWILAERGPAGTQLGRVR